ncbi:Highly reducing polyketide synthase ALT1 [Cladobotryum mycophilum]|uniref:Highly reducing polyketide synthase ALT1 n=1 Tax=Cladobotryum mycophilum TaxID=491253 RepID=A0ABR0SPW2_9HYPO
MSSNETIFLEIGAHSSLQSPIHQVFQERSTGKVPVYVPTLARENNSVNSILSSVGRMYALGYAVDLSFINPPVAVLADLPNYPFDHSLEYWTESRLSRAWGFRKHPHHELLGSSCLEASDTEPAWRNLLRLFDVP